MQTGSDDAVKVHAMVGKETVIFRRHHGIDDGLGKILVAHQPPLAAGIVKQRGDDFRFELVAVQRRGVGKRGDGSDVSVGKLQRRRAFLEIVALKE